MTDVFGLELVTSAGVRMGYVSSENMHRLCQNIDNAARVWS